MDFLTQSYYDRNAVGLACSYAAAATGIASWFEKAFPAGCRVLDVGASSGRDVDLLLRSGWDASGVDPSDAFLREALVLHPRLAGRLSMDYLPRLSTIRDSSFDGVLCAAVLMHVPEHQLRAASGSLCRILRRGGRLLTSLPVDARGCPVNKREFEGRLFNGLSPSSLEDLLDERGFVLLARGRSLDSMGRSERQWVTQLFALEGRGEGASEE